MVSYLVMVGERATPLAASPEVLVIVSGEAVTEEENEQVGYTDPIGTHPVYQKLGLGKAIVTAGLHSLKKKGTEVVELGTSSENIPMQRLAETLGFVVVSEKLWFSKDIT